MKTKSHLVSVVVTTKNNEETLDKCLSSIVNQTYSNIEIIVVDNGSTDKTKMISNSYTKHIFDHGPERSSQRNFGVKKSKGDYIMIVDSDMCLSRSVIDECLKSITVKELSVIIPEESFGEGFWAQCKKLERSFYKNVDWIEAPRFFEKKLYIMVGGYNEKMVGGEDWELHSRIKRATDVARINAEIMHDEGRLTLKEIYKSRKYYTKGFSTHFFESDDANDSGKSGAAQVVGVYLLFLRNPRKLFNSPLRGFGLLFMKTFEFYTIAQCLIVNRLRKVEKI